MVEIIRNMIMSAHKFTDHFKEFERVKSVRQILGNQTESIIEQLKIEFTNATLYMRVDNMDGHILINPDYMNNGDATDIYLDIIHELVHVKQFMEGRNSNPNLSYVKRPLEIEAYGVVVNEARTLGLNEDRILDYLDSDLINQEELKQLAQRLGIKCDAVL
jgi:hypothetical protein